MDRAERRFRTRVAKIRKLRTLEANHRRYWEWHIKYPHCGKVKTWRPLSDLMMTTPSWWTHERCVQPARAEANQLLHKVLRGVEAESLIWPDYRKPHVYYW